VGCLGREGVVGQGGYCEWVDERGRMRGRYSRRGI